MLGKLLTVVLMLFDLDAKKEWGPDDKPKFCGQVDCPYYKLVKKTKTFELRCYPELEWVSTDGVEETGTRKPYMRLRRYIRGENSEEKKIAMGLPVLKKRAVEKVDGKYNILDKFTMSFFLRSPEPPVPKDPSVRLTTTPKTCYYVFSFGGFANTNRDKKYLNKMTARLEEMGLSYDPAVMWSARYSSPYQPLNRHNEVWIKSN